MSLNPIGTRLQCATDSGFNNLVKNYDGNYTTSLVTTAGELPKGVGLYARAAHCDAVLGWADWSTVRSFMIANYQKWVAYLQTNGPSYFNGCTVDNNGNVYAAGHTYVGSNYYPYLTKWSADGTVQWQKCLQFGGSSYFNGCTVDNNGNVYAAGYTYVGGNYYPLKIATSPDGPTTGALPSLPTWSWVTLNYSVLNSNVALVTSINSVGVLAITVNVSTASVQNSAGVRVFSLY